MPAPTPISAPNLARLRRDGQTSNFYLTFHLPATVLACRLNGAPASFNSVIEINYDTVTSGAYGNVLAGMTLYVGSTPGADDLGQARIRVAPTSSILYLGETSDIAWVDNAYLTVVDEFQIWGRAPFVDGTTAYMDRNVAYSDQHTNCDPVPVLGPHAVTWLFGASVDVTFNASDSWVIGSTITGYSWSAPGSSGLAGGATATPTITYNATGTYRVSCAVTAANGKTFTGYRYVFVYSDNALPTTQFSVTSVRGAKESAGWTFQVTLYGEASRTQVRDRTMVILFARDWYGTEEISLGSVPGRENIVALGWIDGETINRTPDGAAPGEVVFEVKGTAAWLKMLQDFPAGILDFDGVPTAWTQFNDLNVQKGIWHFLHWRNTATMTMDCYPVSDSRQIAESSAPEGDPFQQLMTMAEQTILAEPVVDRFGRLTIEIDAQLIPVADRAGLPVLEEIADVDWTDQITI